MSRIYDPKTKKWIETSDSSTTTTTTTTDDSKKTTTTTDTKTTTTSSSDSLTSTSTDSSSSTGDVEKKYNTIEINTLNGTLNFIVTKETIKLKAGDTVKLEGLGKYLTGSYYVKDITRQISSNGYSHSATLIKTDFGKSLKTSSSNSNTSSTTTKKTTTTKKETSNKTTKKTTKRTYTVKKGDCLWSIAKKYYGNGAKWTKIYNANKSKISNPNLIYVGQKLVIP